MEIRQIRCFRTVVEAGGVGRAGALLQVTPGTVSKVVTALEAELGYRLFLRVGRGLELSDAGRAFYDATDRLMAEYAQLVRTVESVEPLEALAVASFEPFTTHVLAAAVDAELADVDLHVVERAPGQIEEAVLAQEVDAGVTYAPRPDRRLDFQRVALTEFAVFGRPAYRRVPFDELPFAVPIATVTRGPLAPLTVDTWPVERRRRVRYRLTSLESALALARRGRCVVYLPTFVADRQNDTCRQGLRLHRIDVPGLRSRRQRVSVVTRRGSRPGSLVSRLVRALRTALR